MKTFLKELNKIEKEHPEFFKKKKLTAISYISFDSGNPCVSFYKPMHIKHPLPKKILTQIKKLLKMLR